MLLARIYETLPLACPNCHAPMRIIAFITEAGTVRKILDHLGESAQPPRIAPARDPPLWEAAMASERASNDSQWDSAEQPEPVFEFDQRVAWRVGFLLTLGRLVRCVCRASIFKLDATNSCDGNGLAEKSLWFWGRKSGALGKFCLTCAVEFPILKIFVTHLRNGRHTCGQ